MLNAFLNLQSTISNLQSSLCLQPQAKRSSNLQRRSPLHLTRLPEMHKDPFDRMLICQAIVQGLVILTPDELIMQYPIRCIW